MTTILIVALGVISALLVAMLLMHRSRHRSRVQEYQSLAVDMGKDIADLKKMVSVLEIDANRIAPEHAYLRALERVHIAVIQLLEARDARFPRAHQCALDRLRDALVRVPPEGADRPIEPIDLPANEDEPDLWSEKEDGL